MVAEGGDDDDGADARGLCHGDVYGGGAELGAVALAWVERSGIYSHAPVFVESSA